MPAKRPNSPHRRSPQPTQRDCPASWRTYENLRTVKVNERGHRVVSCPACGKEVVRNLDGTIRRHVPPGVAYRTTPNARSQAEKFAKRNERILRLRAEEKTLQEIGDLVGLSRERVRQILVDLDGR